MYCWCKIGAFNHGDRMNNGQSTFLGFKLSLDHEIKLELLNEIHGHDMGIPIRLYEKSPQNGCKEAWPRERGYAIERPGGICEVPEMVLMIVAKVIGCDVAGVYCFCWIVWNNQPMDTLPNWVCHRCLPWFCWLGFTCW
jgi:hypothetical protein